MARGPIPLPLQLGPVPEASSQARRYVTAELSRLGATALVDAAQLGVSELVTNACLHARTQITVKVRVTAAGKVRIEVADDSPRAPRERTTETMTTTGRGLRLLAAFGSWGVAAPTEDRTGKTVWFEPTPDNQVEADQDWAGRGASRADRHCDAW